MWQLLSTVKSSRTIVIARARSCGRRKSKFDPMPNIDIIRGKKSGHALAWDTGRSQYCAADGRTRTVSRHCEPEAEGGKRF